MVSIIIVNFNNHQLIKRNIQYLEGQEFKIFEVIIVDNSSEQESHFTSNLININHVKLNSNVGFSRANNLGYLLSDSSYPFVLFLNPDAFLPKDWLKTALDFLEHISNSRVGLYSTPLFGFDFQKNQPNDIIDSLGIYQKWFGQWYDKGQGKSIKSYHVKFSFNEPKAVCGALMFFRKATINDSFIKNNQIFDESFFMYKEDIELSLRLKKTKWKIVMNFKSFAYHCRGWNKQREFVPKELRLIAAKNEILLHMRYSPFHLIYSITKYFYVKLIE